MYVKGLRLAGFKSFADATLLEFDPGINVIVGPNGSGKSNIADALSWALGAQAPSSLRGGSMEDVIFAGSPTRRSLGIADVEITLDNSSRLLPLDLAEVTIGRSTDRSGVTEYRINGAACRLLDVAELLSDTGIGRSLHTVVGQGQLDEVLQARPEDRRSFIEEAAQIGKYRRRKERSLRKIERVDENVTRLNDVLAELRRALRPLKRQATAATAYSEMLTEHRELKQRLAGSELRRVMADISRADAEADARRASLLADELAHVRALLERATGEREARADAADRAQRVAHRMGRSADRFSGLARLATERVATVSARLAAETEEGYRERIRLFESDRRRWEQEARERHAAATEVLRGALEAKEHAERLTAARDEAERLLTRARLGETEAAQALVRAEGSEAAGRATLGSIEARAEAASERRDVMRRQLATRVTEVGDAEAEVRALEGELDQAVGEAAEAETRLEQARDHAEALRRQWSITQADRAAAVARVETLEEVSSVLAARPDVIALLDPLFASAREAARLAQLNVQEANRIVARADEEAERLWQVVAGHDEEVRRLDALLSAAAERLTARRRQHETAEIELAAVDEEIARIKDELARAERAAVEERASLPARQAAVDEAKRAREQTETAVAAARQEQAEAAAAGAAAEVQARTTEERALAAQLRFEEAEAGIAEAEEALAGLEDLRTRLRAERDRAEQLARIARAVAETAREWSIECEERAVAAREEALAAETRLSSLRARERELTAGLEEASRKRHEMEVRRAELRTRAQALSERALDEWGTSGDDLLALDGLDDEEETRARQRVERLDLEMRRLGAVNPRAAEEYEELAERERFLEDQIEDLRRSKRDLMKVVHEVDETIVQVFAEAFQDVAHEFEGVFERLFPGGHGRLKLVDPDDLLNTGIEVEARPPGKNVKKLSLLSGGERSLVALAFLFSIFRARPSPFYLLDEVEAALDDVNLQRFLSLVKELQEAAQVLIVTHQKRTMEAADVLYGVSMGRDGVSEVVAKRMDEVSV